VKQGRRNLLLAVGCVFVSVVVWLAWPREREPEYEGKKLSWWVRQLEYEPQSRKSAAELQELFETGREAREAVPHMGTNALPWLVRWIAYERPAWQRQQWAVNAVSKIPVASFRRWAIWGNSARADAAVIAFGTMGQKAEPAVPELTKLIHDDQRPSSRNRAVNALASISAGFPPLLALLREKVAVGDLTVASLIAERIALMETTRDAVIGETMPALLFGAGTHASFRGVSF